MEYDFKAWVFSVVDVEENLFCLYMITFFLTFISPKLFLADGVL